MAEIQSLSALTSAPTPSAREKLTKGSGVTSKTARPQVKKLSDSSGRYVKLCLYGDYGTGKTYSICDLVELFGQKILVLTTDIGGDGLGTVVAELRRRGRVDLLDTHVFHVTLDTYEQFVEFIEDPTKYFPEIYDVGIDMLVWDGFSGFQQSQIVDYVESLPEVYDQQGNVITLKYWGAIKSCTLKNLNRFLYLQDKKNGKLWHKLVTCLVNDVGKEEDLAAASNEKERLKVRKDVKAPLVQGSAAKLIGPAFDVFFQTATRSVRDENNQRRTEFIFKTVPTDKQKAKLRGPAFDPIIPAHMGEVWQRLTESYGLSPYGADHNKA
jgi:hypothetical protein